jgi:peptidoglycan-N-acetylmuramic acid deacetylase
LGYKTIFWSLAYLDYDVENQPGKAAAYQHVMDNYHDGGIFLLHAVSQSNTEALDDILKALKAQGYSFASLYDLPKY